MSRTSPKSPSLALAKVRELVRIQQALHSSLVMLQQRTAGLATRRQLEEWYRDGKIDAAEFLTFVLATGASAAAAERALADAHASAPPLGTAELLEDLIEPDLPDYSMPSRTPRRRPGKANEMRGHPLD